jgi:phospholipid/cholesterol/gamma-HCH transport system substrate-binding protein
MKRAIRTHLRDFGAILVLVIIAAVVGGYILSNQRLRFPIIEAKPKLLHAEFSTAQAVTPGQGQTVNVSGVQIGDVGPVRLENGRAIVTLQIDPKYADLVREDAQALLRPRTALKDMFIEITPGDGPVAREDFTIPVANTLPDVNPEEVLAQLDSDTRDYLVLLINGAAEGLDGQGGRLRELFRRFEPTHRDLARVSGKVRERRQNLRRLVTNLNRLNTELAERDDDLAQLVDSSARVFRAFASESPNITAAVEELPSALRRTTETLTKVERFAGIMQPSLERLRPAVRRIDDVNAALRPFAEEATPILRDEIRPFVREARPLVRELRPAAGRLADSTPDLTRSFVVLNRLFNLIGFNPEGRQGPEVAGREEGYLFWIAWLGHNGGALFSSSSPTGILRPVAIQVNCAIVRQSVADQPEIEFLQGLVNVLLDPRICPEGQG